MSRIGGGHQKITLAVVKLELLFFALFGTHRHLWSFVAKGPSFGVIRAKQYPVQGGGLGYGEQGRAEGLGRLEESAGSGTRPVAVA